MVIEINTVVTVGQNYGKGLANITLYDAKFFGRPNFAGEMDRFKDDRRKFQVLIPNEAADELRALGWNVKTKIPTPQELEVNPDLQEISFLKVMVDDISSVFIIVGDDRESLSTANFGAMDRLRIQEMDMELRAWNYNEDEVKLGIEEPKWSARLVQLVATVQFNLLEQKYGRLS